MKEFKVLATLHKVLLILSMIVVSPRVGANISISILNLDDRIVQLQKITQNTLNLSIVKMTLNQEYEMETSNPNDVKVNWSPHHYGHWVWVDPWGWTWDDDAPWGLFANPSVSSAEVLQPTSAIAVLREILSISSAIDDVLIDSKNTVQNSVTAALNAAKILSHTKMFDRRTIETIKTIEETARPTKPVPFSKQLSRQQKNVTSEALDASEETSINIQAYHPPQNPIVIESPKPKVAQRVFPSLENVIEKINIVPNVEGKEWHH